MITEDFVSFEIAKLLREKGFDEHTICRYVDDNGATEKWYDNYREKVLRFELNAGDLIEPSIEPKEKYELYGDTIPAPTLYGVMEWLRVNHNLFIEVRTGETDQKTWYDFDIIPINGRIVSWEDLEDIPIIECELPKEAIEIAIKYCLKNLI